MKKIATLSAAAAALVLSGIDSGAQEFRTGYFLDNNIYNYRYNAAMYAEDEPNTFFGLLIGNFTTSMDANQGMSNFFFPKDGKLYNGLSREIKASDFLGNLGQYTTANAEINQNIFAIGWKGEKFYNTIELNARSNTYCNINNDAFALLKQGGSIAGNYDVAGSSANTRNWVEIAYGMSFKLPLGFKFGYRVKGLIGVASASAAINSLAGSADSDGYVSLNQGNGLMTVSGIVSPVINNDGQITGLTTIGNTLGGGGVAFDMGVHWESAFGLSANIGINDVGGIIWADQHVVDMTSKAVSTKENIEIDTEKLLVCKEREKTNTTTFSTLPIMLNAGARYKLPFFTKLSVGALATFHFGDYKWSEGRFALTITPVDIISITANMAVNSFGWGYGAAINLRVPVVNIFFGGEMNNNSFSPQGYPVYAPHATINAGLSFVIK